MTNQPFGSWPSPISARLVGAGGVGLSGPAVRRAPDDGEQTEIWWAELRPEESGRSVLVRAVSGPEATGIGQDMLVAPFSARTRVHEYGGGAWFLGQADVYFSNWDDQRLYRLTSGGLPEAITPVPSERHGLRFADGVEGPDGSWLVAVMESHDGSEVLNQVVVIPTNGDGEPVVVVSGSDFVSTPRVSPDGRWLSWIRWDHPNMPWDGTELCAAPLFDGPRLGNVQVVAGGPHESVHAANWTADGRLLFSTDRSGFWNLHQWTPGDSNDRAITELVGSEIGSPPWVFGVQPWTELSDGSLVAVQTTAGNDRLLTIRVDGTIETLPSPFVAVSGLAATSKGDLVCVAQTAVDLPAVAVLSSAGRLATFRAPTSLGIDGGWFSRAEAIEFPSAGGRRSHAFFYRPTGLDVSGSADELPPLIVMGHGGPTAHTSPAFNLKVQFWTSRGFAVVDVNYGGSTGFGRHYRRLLERAWGIVDVEDCVAAAEFLAASGRVDRERMAIRGGSAGGFTVLAALTGSRVFSAGTSLYGVADLEALATDTHKFESRYLDSLIGPYPDAKPIYEERSPIHHVDKLSCPLLVLQGMEDEIVPPNQAEAIVAALAANGIPHAAIYFEGEQHGFRRAENIVRSLEAELWFYGRVFGFDPADRIEPIAGAVGLNQ